MAYPYTVHLQYELKTSSTGFLPNWSPQEGFDIAIQKSAYTLQLPGVGNVRMKELNFGETAIVKQISDRRVHYEVRNLPAIEYESLSPSIRTFTPRVLMALNLFTTDGVKGYYTNWNEFGQWMHDELLEGRELIDTATKTQIKTLVAGVTDEIERAKIIYNFVQQKVRYISVQVGVGGIQPIPAKEVDAVGYGDCKGLTNYTKALLEVAGVTSYYTHVEANKNSPISFDKDFASLEQGNHVILNLPNNGNDIWLECTSQTTPFGFLGRFTDDRDVLVITPEGGVVKHTTSYKNEQNLQNMSGDVQLDSLGNITASVIITSKGTQYDSSYGLTSLTKKEVKDFYATGVWGENNNLTVDSWSFENDKQAISFEEKIAVVADRYATVSENTLLLKVNVFNRSTYVPKRYRERKYSLKINRGYKDVDVFTITLPIGYELETVPQKKTVNTPFGSYESYVEKTTKNTLTYHRSIFIKEGAYPKEAYAKYRKFRKKIVKYDNVRIELVKKTQ